MGDSAEAQKLIDEAEDLLKPGKYLFFFTTTPNHSEAAENYNKAAIIYKTSKHWREAGDCYKKSAELDEQAGESDELAKKLLNAASCYKQCDVQLATVVIKEALDILLKSGRFHLAAAHEKELGELYEVQLHDYDSAINYYVRAADRYAGEDSESISQSCRLKAAGLYALNRQYEEAAAIYEEVANNLMHDASRKYQIRDYLFRAGLCRLVLGDRVAARRSLDSFLAADPSFGGRSKEYELLNNILEALNDEDVEAFTGAVSKYDRTSPVDDWMTKILLRIKESINVEPDLL